MAWSKAGPESAPREGANAQDIRDSVILREALKLKLPDFAARATEGERQEFNQDGNGSDLFFSRSLQLQEKDNSFEYHRRCIWNFTCASRNVEDAVHCNKLWKRTRFSVLHWLYGYDARKGQPAARHFGTKIWRAHFL
jgi:hypothetical protein